ncbi:MAG: DUF5785 family protein [Halobacteriales archaeon]|nr:DUF5785 family protein [Halobacteriales archaeon]
MPINEPDDGKSYGMSAVANWIEEDDFPTTKDDLLSRFSDRDVMLGYDTETTFGEIMEHVEQEEYDDIVDFWGALGDGFRAVDERIRERYIEG